MSHQNEQGLAVESIEFEDRQLALIVRREFHTEGIRFFTPSTYSQQLGYMYRRKGYVIPPHVHNPVRREVEYTKEVLFIRKGSVRVDFYSEDQTYISSTVLLAGDIILLAFGGHGFEVLDDAEIVEVKQGPYAGDQDKTRFSPVGAEHLKIRGSR